MLIRHHPRLNLLSAKGVPTRSLSHLLQTLTQGATGHAQTIDSRGVWLDQIMFADEKWIKTQIISQFVQVNLNRAARLRCAMPALGTTRRLIGKKAHALEF